MLYHIEEMLATLGAHFPWILVGCLEILAAVILLGMYTGRKSSRKKNPKAEGDAGLFLKETGNRTDAATVLVRCADKMPVYAYGALEDILGMTLESLQQDITRGIDYLEDPSNGKKAWKSYLSWNGKEPLQTDFLMQKGEWLSLRVERSADGLYDIFTLSSSTKNHEKIRALEEKLAETEEASQSKTTFLSRMSHEIRTPMNGIIGMLELARNRVDADHPVIQYLEKAGELSDHMRSLINDILDMSRIEAGKVELEEKPFSLRAMGQKLYDMFAKNLEARGIAYHVDFKDMTVDQVVGDELRLSQVIINFLSNAVKFTSEGEISVTFQQMLLKEDMVDLLIRVHDTGIGMKQEFIKKIFRPFEQESMETSKNYGGTGLGMAITDQIVKLMGGEIVVESMQGEGSDFFIYLHFPVAKEDTGLAQPQNVIAEPEETAPAAEENTDSFKGMRILLAEDNEINAMIAEEILTEMGASVDLAENGQVAVDKFAAQPEHYYDFILMDIQMPVLDGRGAARQIRAMDRSDAGDILIFALSADAFVEDMRLSEESGMNGHFTKPVDYMALQKEIGVYLREKEENRSEKQ